MKIRTRSKSLLAGALALGLGFVAAPAIAQDAEVPVPTLSVEQTVFTTAGWGDGIPYTLQPPAGVAPDELVSARIALAEGGYHVDGGYGDTVVAYETLDIAESDNGAFTGVLEPDFAPEMPSEVDGFVSPFYIVFGSYAIGDPADEDSWEWVHSEEIALDVIDPELSIDGPATASVSQITGDGVEIEIRGFQPGETVHVSGNSSATGELDGAFDEQVDINGRLSLSLFVTAANPGDTITFTFAGESGELTHTVTVVADQADEDDEDDEDDDETVSPTPPESVETGIL